jgi:hypothetical protein
VYAASVQLTQPRAAARSSSGSLRKPSTFMIRAMLCSKHEALIWLSGKDHVGRPARFGVFDELGVGPLACSEFSKQRV